MMRLLLLPYLFCILMGSAAADIPRKNYILSFKENIPLQSKSNKSQSIALKQQHNTFKNNLTQLFKRKPTINFEYKYALNGMSLSLTDAEFKILSERKDLNVTPEEIYTIQTDASGAMIRADKLWDGSAIAPLLATQGEDVVIGILDTGINMQHESFTDIAEDNYDFSQHNPYGANTYVGWCNPSHPNYDVSYVCNNKLIGAWDFVDAFGNESDGPEDNNIHGSWMAGIAAGNTIAAPMGGFVSSFGSFILDAPFISGIAPHAHVIIYDVCDNAIGCPSSAILAAIEQAIVDGVDVLNMSLDGGLQPWSNNSIALALLNAQNFGISTSAAAGNATSAQPSTLGRVNNIAPWIITSANSLHGRTHSNDISVIDPMPVPIFLVDMYARLAVGLSMIADSIAPITYGFDVNNSNVDGCQNWNMGDFNNSIALIESGNCANNTKVQNAQNAGAVGVIIFQTGSDLPVDMTGVTSSIPALSLGLSDANSLITFIHDNAGNPSIIQIASDSVYKIVNALGFVLYHSSLRGPNFSFNVTKPDIASPGTNIFAAIADLSLPAPQYLLGTGTSQATAVTTGAIALLKSLKPNWSPAEIKSALMLTAREGIKFENQTATNFDDVGSGLLDVSAAANTTLVLDESINRYLSANPALGGQSHQLNLASLRNNACVNSCSWIRTLTNTDTVTHSWNISVAHDANSEIIVSAAQITLLTNQSQSIDINFNQVSGSSNEYRYGQIILTDVDGLMPQLKMTLVVYLDHLVFSNGFE